MAKETEVFRLDLDTSPIERKAARVEQIISEIKTKRGKEDTSDLERQLNKELDGMAQLAQHEKKAAGTTEQLTKQKEKLGAAMRVVGSQSSGVIADLGGVVELMVSGQKAAIGLGGALAGLGAVIGVVQHIRSEFEKLRDEQEKIDQAYRAMKQTWMDASLSMAETLQKSSALTEETWQATQSLYKPLTGRFGADVARQIAPLAAMEGLGGDEAALAGQLALMGLRVEPGQIREAIAKLQTQKPEAIAAAKAQLARVPEEVARQRAVSAEAIPAGLPRKTPAERVIDYLAERNILVGGEEGMREARPADVERIMQLTEELGVAEAELKRLRKRSEVLRWLHGKPEGDVMLTVAAKRRQLAEFREAAEVVPARMAREAAAEAGQVAPLAPPPAPVYTQPVNVVNIGTQYNAPDTRSRPLVGSIGVSAAAAGQHKVPLGG